MKGAKSKKWNKEKQSESRNYLAQVTANPDSF
jgi:hypothetical protein